MAKARHVALDPYEPFEAAARRVVAARADEVFEQAGDVLDTEDIERVHDMRVATRRLRAVLEIYAVCFPKKPHRAVLREVKELADALGARRDPDVLLERLDDLEVGEPTALAVFRVELRAEQAAGKPRPPGALAEIRERDLHGRLRGLGEAAA